MTQLNVFDAKDALIATADATAGDCLAKAIVESFPDGFGDVVVFVYTQEGYLIEPKYVPETIVMPGQCYMLYLRPKAAVLALPALFGLTTVGGLLLAGLSLAATFLMRPKLPDITPQESYRWDNSDEPQFFSAQSNQLRVGQRVPDVFGNIRIWPDLILEPHTVFNGSDQTTEELYVISNGDVIVSNTYLHDEDLIGIPNSGFDVYRPINGQKWPSEAEMPVYRSNSYVQNINLSGPNNASALSVTFTFDTSGYIEADVSGYFSAFTSQVGKWVRVYNTAAANSQIYYIDSITNNDQRLNVTPSPGTNATDSSVTLKGILNLATNSGGKLPRTYSDTWKNWFRNPAAYGLGYFDFRGSDVGQTAAGFSGGQMTNPAFTKTWNASFKTLSGYSVNGVQQPNINGFDVGNRRDQTFGSSFYYLKYASGSYAPTVPGTGLTTSIFRVPGTVTQIACDFEFPQGLYKQVANQGPIQRNVTVRMYYRAADTEDVFMTHDFVMSASERALRRFTKTLDVPQGDYEAYFQRTTEEVDSGGNFVAADTTQLVGLRGRQVFTTELLNDVLECTLIKLTLNSTNMQQIGSTRSFNVVCTRQLPDNSFDGDTTRAFNESIEQSILYTLIDLGGYDPNLIDTVGLAAIQTDLNAMAAAGSGAGLATFNAILDQTNTVEDQVMTMAGVGRIIVYRRGGKIYFSRLKQGLVPTRLITNRNKVSAEQRNMNFGDNNDATSVIIRFLDASDNFNEGTVQWPDPATTPGADVNPEEQSVIGITDRAAALQAATYIWDKRQNERDTISIPIQDDGILLSPGEVIAVTDALEPNSVALDGTIADISGTIWSFGQIVPPGNYSLRVTDTNGEVFHYDPNFTVVTADVAFDLGVAAPAQQPSVAATVGLRWQLLETNDEGYALFYVNGVDPSLEGPVQVEATTYRQETFESDNLSGTLNASTIPQAQKPSGTH